MRERVSEQVHETPRRGSGCGVQLVAHGTLRGGWKYCRRARTWSQYTNSTQWSIL